MQSEYNQVEKMQERIVSLENEVRVLQNQLRRVVMFMLEAEEREGRGNVVEQKERRTDQRRVKFADNHNLPLTETKIFSPYTSETEEPDVMISSSEESLSAFGDSFNRTSFPLVDSGSFRLTRSGFYTWTLRNDEPLRFSVENTGSGAAFCSIEVNLPETLRPKSLQSIAVRPSNKVVIPANQDQAFELVIPNLDSLRPRNSGATDEEGSGSENEHPPSHDILISVTWGEESQRQKAKEALRLAPARIVDSFLFLPYVNESLELPMETGGRYPIDPMDVEIISVETHTMEIFVSLSDTGKLSAELW